MNYTFYLKTDVEIDESKLKNLIMQSLLNEGVKEGKIYNFAHDKRFAIIEHGKFVSTDEVIARQTDKVRKQTKRIQHKDKVFEVLLSALGSKRIVEIPAYAIKANARCAPYHYHCQEPMLSDIEKTTSIVVDLVDIVYLGAIFNMLKYKFDFNNLEGDKEKAKLWASKVSEGKLLQMIGQSTIRRKNILAHYVLTKGFYMPDQNGNFYYVAFADLKKEQ